MLPLPSSKPTPLERAAVVAPDDDHRRTIVPAFDPDALARSSEAQGASWDEGDDTERPTLVPPFDPEAFARDSEVKQRAARPTSLEPTIDEARRLLASGEAEEALFLLARLLEAVPLHAEGSALSNECRGALERECLSSVGSLSSVLVVDVRPDELKGYGLDNLSGFLLSLLDGATDVETVLDLCGRPRLLALRHLRGLVDRGVVRVAKRSG